MHLGRNWVETFYYTCKRHLSFSLPSVHQCMWKQKKKLQLLIRPTFGVFFYFSFLLVLDPYYCFQPGAFSCFNLHLQIGVLTMLYGLPTIVSHYNRVAMKERSVLRITKYAVPKKSIMNFCNKWLIVPTIVWTNSIICFLIFHLGLKDHETIDNITMLFFCISIFYHI